MSDTEIVKEQLPPEESPDVYGHILWMADKAKDPKEFAIELGKARRTWAQSLHTPALANDAELRLTIKILEYQIGVLASHIISIYDEKEEQSHERRLNIIEHGVSHLISSVKFLFKEVGKKE